MQNHHWPLVILGTGALAVVLGIIVLVVLPVRRNAQLNPTSVPVLSPIASSTVATSTQQPVDPRASDTYVPVPTPAMIAQQQASSTPAPDTRASATYAGHYVRTDGTGELDVAVTDAKHLSISGDAQWIGQGEGNVNTGVFDAIVSLSGHVAKYTDGGSSCAVTFDFSDTKTVVSTKQATDCGWGSNVDFAGTYKKK